MTYFSTYLAHQICDRLQQLDHLVGRLLLLGHSDIVRATAAGGVGG